MGVVSASATIAALGAAAFLVWKRALPKVSTVLLLVAASGIGGIAGRWLRAAANAVSGFVDQITRIGIGAAASDLITIGLALIVLWDLRPKGKANRLTQAAAFALPLFGVAGNGVVADLFGAIVTAIGGVLDGLTTYL